jgi:RNA polymerase sigma-70 factor (ECF subfamily)
MTKTELNQLVKQLQNGEMQVFDMIYHETKSIVYYTILGILKDSSLAEDIMQETYLKSLEKIHSFKPRYSFSAWLVTIARNMAFNEFNRRKRELSYDPNEDDTIFGQVDSMSEKQLMIRDMLEILDETEREVVVMHILGDLKHREIAEALKKPIGTVTWIYNKAITKLQDKFGE